MDDVVFLARPEELAAPRRNPGFKPSRFTKRHAGLGTPSAKYKSLLVRTALVRSSTYDSRKLAVVRSAKDVAELVGHLGDLDQELMLVLAIGVGGKVYGVQEVATGGTKGVSQEARHIVKVPLLAGPSTGAIVVHNHPSGSTTHDIQDKRFTASVEKALGCVGLKLVDSIIIAQDKYYSFREHGKLAGKRTYR